MNYLFLLIGNDSYYEAFIMSKLVEQIQGNSLIVCFTGFFQSSYFFQNEKIYSVLLNEDIEINKENFERTIKTVDFSSIIIFDFHKSFSDFNENNEKKNILFNMEWLQNIDTPIAVIDYLDIFDYDILGQLYLKDSSSFIKEEKEESESKKNIISPYSIYPKIIKLCPPCTIDENASNNFAYLNFNYLDLAPKQDIELAKEYLGLQDGVKNIVLIFSHQMILRSYITDFKLLTQYSLVANSIITYLKSLNIKANLFIVGSDLKYETEKIKVKSFKTINHDLYNALISSADLLMVDTTWHPALIDAANLKIPVGVIGNSLIIKEDNSLKANYNEIDENIYNQIKECLDKNTDIFFPYTSFPLKVNEFPEWGIYENKFLYYLLDIYDVEKMLSFLGQFLTDKEELKEINKNLEKVQEEYSNRAINTLNLQELLSTLTKDAK